MILLDTNVISEAMKPEPNASVQAWLNEQPEETLFLSSVTLAELLFGIGVLPEGKRKTKLKAVFDRLLDLFKDRVLSFDTEAAKKYSDLAVTARSSGKGFPTPDGSIAAIAVANKMLVATRDTGPFEAAEVSIIDPWNYQSQA